MLIGKVGICVVLASLPVSLVSFLISISICKCIYLCTSLLYMCVYISVYVFGSLSDLPCDALLTQTESAKHCYPVGESWNIFIKINNFSKSMKPIFFLKTHDGKAVLCPEEGYILV